jgi:hypothetical protein
MDHRAVSRSGDRRWTDCAGHTSQRDTHKTAGLDGTYPESSACVLSMHSQKTNKQNRVSQRNRVRSQPGHEDRRSYSFIARIKRVGLARVKEIKLCHLSMRGPPPQEARE